MYWLFRIFKRIKATPICILLALQLLLICMLLFCVVVFVDRHQSGHRSWQLFEVRQGRTRRTSTFFRSISAIDSGILLLLFMFTVGCCGFREVVKPQCSSNQFIATAGSWADPISANQDSSQLDSCIFLRCSRVVVSSWLSLAEAY